MVWAHSHPIWPPSPIFLCYVSVYEIKNQIYKKKDLLVKKTNKQKKNIPRAK